MAQVPKILCYPNQLNQLFLNLLRNAVEALNPNGTITIETRADTASALIKIADTGQRNRAREPSQDLRSRVYHQGGRNRNGLGLSIAYSIVQKHQGQIQVESEAGKGTTFTVTLPIKVGLTRTAASRIHGLFKTEYRLQGPHDRVNPIGRGSIVDLKQSEMLQPANIDWQGNRRVQWYLNGRGFGQHHLGFRAEQKINQSLSRFGIGPARDQRDRVWNQWRTETALIGVYDDNRTAGEHGQVGLIGIGEPDGEFSGFNQAPHIREHWELSLRHFA